MMQFIDNMNHVFDKLMGRVEEQRTIVDLENLSLVRDDELTAMVLKNLDQVLRDANQLLINQGVIPDLRMDSAKPKERTNSKLVVLTSLARSSLYLQ
ncbi:MAG: hypothetical protein ACI9HA_001006 [Dinoroseobacter sp.]|jgi:hypothetical protein